MCELIRTQLRKVKTMANLPFNIERSEIKHADYISHAHKIVWYIKKSTSSYGNWVAIPSHHKGYDNCLMASRIYAFTLGEMGVKLDAWKIPEGANLYW